MTGKPTARDIVRGGGIDAAEAERAADLLSAGIAQIGDGPGLEQVVDATLAQIREESDR